MIWKLREIFICQVIAPLTVDLVRVHVFFYVRQIISVEEYCSSSLTVKSELIVSFYCLAGKRWPNGTTWLEGNSFHCRFQYVLELKLHRVCLTHSGVIFCFKGEVGLQGVPGVAGLRVCTSSLSTSSTGGAAALHILKLSASRG